MSTIIYYVIMIKFNCDQMHVVMINHNYFYDF